MGGTEFKRTAKQREAMAVLSNNTYSMLFGGSRSGKTFIILRALIIRACMHKSRHLVVRLRYNHVRTSIWLDTLPKVMSLCFPNLSYTNKTQDGYIVLPNGSEIWFGGVDSKERTEKILGNEYSTIYAGECSQIAYEAITILMTRLAENTPLTKRFFFDCNPPSMAHWTYKLFLKGECPQTGKPKKMDGYGSLLMNPNDNRENLPQIYMDILESLPERDKDRFLRGKFLSDVEGALWSTEALDKARSHYTSYEELLKEVPINSIMIGVDPSIETQEDSDLCGIVVAAKGDDGLYYVLDDCSIKASPDVWATAAIETYHKYNANALVVETNQGGKMAATIFKSKGFFGKIIEVHASKSKHARAQPVEALYEQDKVRHLDNGKLKKLEEELLCYVPLTASKSPDRLDALVWAISKYLDKRDTIGLLKSGNLAELNRIARGG
jgi:predicted phage terminase large subunit-like protein